MYRDNCDFKTSKTHTLSMHYQIIYIKLNLYQFYVSDNVNIIKKILLSYSLFNVFDTEENYMEKVRSCYKSRTASSKNMYYIKKKGWRGKKENTEFYPFQVSRFMAHLKPILISSIVFYTNISNFPHEKKISTTFNTSTYWIHSLLLSREKQNCMCLSRKIYQIMCSMVKSFSIRIMNDKSFWPRKCDRK